MLSEKPYGEELKTALDTVEGHQGGFLIEVSDALHPSLQEGFIPLPHKISGLPLEQVMAIFGDDLHLLQAFIQDAQYHLSRAASKCINSVIT